jgi:hypothetical protein
MSSDSSLHYPLSALSFYLPHANSVASNPMPALSLNHTHFPASSLPFPISALLSTCPPFPFHAHSLTRPYSASPLADPPNLSPSLLSLLYTVARSQCTVDEDSTININPDLGVNFT